MTPVLSVRGLEKRFGAVVAADALNLDIVAGRHQAVDQIAVEAGFQPQVGVR